MTEAGRAGSDLRDVRLEDSLRRLDRYRVERTLAEKPGLLTELATRENPDGSTTRVVLKHIALELANPILWDRYRLVDTGHLPELLDVIELPDECVVVLRYIAGVPLEALVTRRGALSPATARSVMDDLCDAASSLATVGIVHRDIKPSNVILSPRGTYLIDPGIARISDNHGYEEPRDHDTVVLGTYGYAPPEQMGFAPTDARSDVFSLARVLGFMLTGISPTEPLYLDALRNDRRIPDGLRLVISHACALEPSLRPANAQALKRQIDANISSKDTAVLEEDRSHASGGTTGKSVIPHVRPPAKADVGHRNSAGRRESVAAPQSSTPISEGANPAPQGDPSTALDSDGLETEERPEAGKVPRNAIPTHDGASPTSEEDPSMVPDSKGRDVDGQPEPDVTPQTPTPMHHGAAPTPPKGLSLPADSDGRGGDARQEPGEGPRRPISIRERAIAEPHREAMTDTQRVAVRLIEGFLGFFGTVFIIASFSLGDTSLPGWGNICYGITMGIFWNYLPAYELVQFFKGAGRYRRTSPHRPNVFKRTFMWFGIGFAILAVVSAIVNATGYQGPQ